MDETCMQVNLPTSVHSLVEARSRRGTGRAGVRVGAKALGGRPSPFSTRLGAHDMYTHMLRTLLTCNPR